MYCAGHLIQAAVALRRGAGDGACSPSPCAWPITWSASSPARKEPSTGTRSSRPRWPSSTARPGTVAYLELARQFVDQRGRGLAGNSGLGRRYLQDHMPVRDVGHRGRARGASAVPGGGSHGCRRRDRRRELLDSSVRRWDDMVTAKTYLTGGNGSRHATEGFGDRFELPPGPRLQRDLRRDRQLPVELAAAARHRRREVRRPHGTRALQRLRGRDRHRGPAVLLREPAAAPRGSLREGRPGPAPRLVQLRLLPAEHHAPHRIPGTLSRHGSRDTLYVHQYTGSRLSGAGLDLEVTTDYPWSGAVYLRVLAAPQAVRGLALRVPGLERQHAYLGKQ